MEQINKLIILLTVVCNFSKDIHYTAHGSAFYSKHIFVDKFETAEYIDMIKEVCLLGKDLRPQGSKYYLAEASKLLVNAYEDDDKQNFKLLQQYVKNTLDFINALTDLNKAEENLIGAIAQDLQQYYGLINLQIED